MFVGIWIDDSEFFVHFAGPGLYVSVLGLDCVRIQPEKVSPMRHFLMACVVFIRCVRFHHR